MVVVCALLQIYLLVLVVRVLLSWFPISHDGPMAPVAGFLYTVTDPILLPLRPPAPASPRRLWELPGQARAPPRPRRVNRRRWPSAKRS